MLRPNGDAEDAEAGRREDCVVDARAAEAVQLSVPAARRLDHSALRHPHRRCADKIDAILRFPDVYKVAVSTAGNHDNRTYHAAYAEKYQGLMTRDTVRGTTSYDNQVNASLAKNLKGKLFLMTGDMDDNVHPAMTIQVADALIKANKSFDFLILPNLSHDLNDLYVIRRRWDYLSSTCWVCGRRPTTRSGGR